MSNLVLFLKKNKKVRENTTYAATASLCDEKGNPLEWKIKPLTTSEIDAIREECTIDVQITGKPGQYRQKVLASKFGARLISASVVEPDLYNKELQDSYGVSKPEDLIRAMVDNPGEYNNFLAFVQNYNNFDETMQDKVDEAKN